MIKILRNTLAKKFDNLVHKQYGATIYTRLNKFDISKKDDVTVVHVDAYVSVDDSNIAQILHSLKWKRGH